MVAFTQKGYEDFVYDNGDPKIKKLAGTGVQGVPGSSFLAQLPTEEVARDLHSSIVSAMNSGIDVRQNPTLKLLLDALERDYPAIQGAVANNIQVMLTDTHGNLADLLSTVAFLRDNENVKTESEL